MNKSFIIGIVLMLALCFSSLGISTVGYTLQANLTFEGMSSTDFTRNGANYAISGSGCKVGTNCLIRTGNNADYGTYAFINNATYNWTAGSELVIKGWLRDDNVLDTEGGYPSIFFNKQGANFQFSGGGAFNPSFADLYLFNGSQSIQTTRNGTSSGVGSATWFWHEIIINSSGGVQHNIYTNNSENILRLGLNNIYQSTTNNGSIGFTCFRACSWDDVVVYTKGGVSGILSINSTYPQNNTQFNTPTISINATINPVNTYNCTLNLNSLPVYNWTNLPNTTTFIEYNYTPALSSQNYYYFNCTDNSTSVASNNNTFFYADSTSPTISTNFLSGGVYYLRNIAGQFNFSDDFYLYSYNISIDRLQKYYASGLNITTYQYNLSYDPVNLTTGNHTLTVRIADGHTATEIPEYEIDKGTFNNELNYIDNKDSSIKINKKGKSVFDTFTTIKEKDRYTFSLKPSDKGKSEYTFEVSSDEYIDIINTGSKYKNYLISGNKWIDFVMLDQKGSKVNIKRINNNLVEVTVSNIKPTEILSFSSIGELNIVEQNYTIVKISPSFSYNPTIAETTSQSVSLNINITGTGIGQNGINGSLIYNNTGRAVSKYSDDLTYIRFDSTLTTPEISVNSTLAQFNWTLNLSGTQESFLYNQSIFNIVIDNCSNYTGNFINFTVYDETTKSTSGLTNASIETYVNLSASSYSWSYNASKVGNGTVTLPLCIVQTAYSYTNFTMDLITRYKADNHAVEFYYTQDYPITNGTFQDIKLYTLNTNTLLSEYSTSYLTNYQDSSYINVKEAIVDLQRYYVGEGQYVSVEHGMTDNSGNTVLHLVSEDVIYRAVVRKDNVILYQSDSFTAKCVDTPCKVYLQQGDDLNSIWDYAVESNINYQITFDKPTRTGTVVYSTIDGSTTTAEIKITLNDAYLNQTVCQNNITSSGGSVSCVIPPTASNHTYVLEFNTYNSPANLRELRLITLEEFSLNAFGYTGIIMTFLLMISLVMMALDSGIIVTVGAGLLGVITATLLLIFSGGTILGVGSSLVWLLCAGGIIIWRASK